MADLGDKDVVVIYSTCPDAQTATTIGRALVEDRLAACVNILPDMRSIYRWDGAISEDREVVLIAKSQRGLVQEVTVRIRALHPFDTPAVVALDVIDGSADYLTWVLAETKVSRSPGVRSD